MSRLYAPGDTWRVHFNTADPATGGALDADSTPTVGVYRNGTLDGAVSVTVTHPGTGHYLATATIPGGYTVGDNVSFLAVATVGGVTSPPTVLESVRLDALVNSRLATAGYTAPDNATITAIAGYLDTEITAIKAKTDLIPASPAATGDIPSAASIATAVLTAANGVETGLTLQSAMRLILSVVAGISTVTGGTSIVFKRPDGTTTALTMTFDEDGNRTVRTVGTV